jgi:glycine dehydrogenase
MAISRAQILKRAARAASHTARRGQQLQHPNGTRALATAAPPTSPFAPLDTFARRHIGPDAAEEEKMLAQLGYKSMHEFVQDAIPHEIRVAESSVSNESIPALSESELHVRAKELASENKPYKSYIGMGYHNAVVPPVILRNVGSNFLSSLAYLIEFAGS